MENLTAITLTAAYGLAVLLFFGVFLVRSLSASTGTDSPPALPLGKVAIWPYRATDLIGVIGIAGFFFLMVIQGAMMADDGKDPEISAAALVFNIALQLILAGLATVMMFHRIRPVQWLGLAWKEWPWVFLIAPGVVVTMWAVFAGLYSVGYMELMESLGVEKVQDTVAILQKEEDVGILILMAFTAAIIAPVCEEIVFRGYLYPVAKKFSGPWVAGVCSALVFSAAHGSMSALLPLFIFGLALVALYELTGSIWAPMAVHFLFNGATVAVQMLVRLGVVPDVPQ